jgi:hypothetical protein
MRRGEVLLQLDQVGLGAVNIVSDTLPELVVNSLSNPSQATYVIKSDINPLLPFEGDIIHEGRFGNSLRFGSTAKSLSKYGNNWSTAGNNGDPIFIIRNGQSPTSPKEGWIPVTEDINNDLSSVYLTSFQKIPFKSKFLSEYTQPQVILNSSRIVINSTSDSIILQSQNLINLSSIRSININTPSTTIQSSNIFLGSPQAEEPGVKGNTLNKKLDIILNSLITLVNVLEYQQVWPGGLPSPDGGTMMISSNVKTQLQQELDSLQDILSKVVKTL